MSILKRVPWVSLALVLLSYSTLGWVISENKVPWTVWLTTVFGVLLLVGNLTIPWLKITQVSTIFFRSSTRTFVFAVFSAFLFFLMLAWFRVFLDTLLIIAATILARIDFQTTGCNQKQSFWTMSIISLTGLALGAGMQTVVVR
ncbi:MAG: hypothetical protein KME23_12300 [Goleter apudmare HA4340-LM2]|jgi:hypothetical protein|nr:hypothetical protein [Goleter apudmare HA4340-LM2]